MARILVDTSVWVDFFRIGRSSDAYRLSALLENDEVCTTRLIWAELLSGARHEKEYGRLKDYFSAVPVLTEPADLWDRVAWARFQLARKGVQSSIVDLAIAVIASVHHCALFTQNRQFDHFPRVLPVRIYRTPPH